MKKSILIILIIISFNSLYSKSKQQINKSDIVIVEFTENDFKKFNIINKKNQLKVVLEFRKLQALFLKKSRNNIVYQHI